jgi:hypothetical protein
VTHGRLIWFGHVKRKDKDDWAAACREVIVDGTNGKGIGRKTRNKDEKAWVEECRYIHRIVQFGGV